MSYLTRLSGPQRRWLAATLIAMALIEEVITTTMTNLAPMFGTTPAEAHITGSTNYITVVCFHSVVVFVPMFAAWAWMLSRWDCSYDNGWGSSYFLESELGVGYRLEISARSPPEASAMGHLPVERTGFQRGGNQPRRNCSSVPS